MKTAEKLESLMISEELPVKEAIKQMGIGGERILFVVDDQAKLLGTLTDGDVRRWILSEGNLQEHISKLYNRNPKTVTTRDKFQAVRQIMLQEKLEVLPIIDAQGRLLDAHFWRDILSDAENQSGNREQLAVPVLVMAGGKGSRLDPFTKIFPKPLIPFGEKPIIEHILDRFSGFGCKDFYLSVHYKGKMIQSYFDQEENKHRVTLIWEDQPMGTAGSLREAAKHIRASRLFVSNCDILLHADYADLHRFHMEHDNDITIAGSMQHVSVPFGVLHIKNGGVLDKIVEKPEYDFLVNTGFYLVKKSAVEHIPKNGSVDFPEFITRVCNAGGNVRVYPVSRNAWTDIGQWQEYKNAIYHLEP